MTDRARELVEKLPSKELFCHGTIPEPLSAEERQWLVDQLHAYPKRVDEARTCAIGALTEMATTEFCRLMAEQSLTPPEGDTVSEGVVDPWKPDPEDPFWMLEIRQGFEEAGSWLKNEKTYLTTRDPLRAIRYPSRFAAECARRRLPLEHNGRFEPTDHQWINHAALQSRVRTPPEGDTVSDEALLNAATPEQINRANDAVFANLDEMGVPKYDSAFGYACALTAIIQSDAALQSRVSPQAGMREALREAREALDRLLDYALVHDSGLVEHEEEGKQSPLVTDAKRALATIDKALLAVEGG